MFKNIQRGDIAREGQGAKTEEETSGCHKGILYYVSFSNFFRSPICHIPTKPTVECPNFGSLTLTANPSAFWTNWLVTSLNSANVVIGLCQVRLQWLGDTVSNWVARKTPDRVLRSSDGWACCWLWPCSVGFLRVLLKNRHSKFQFDQDRGPACKPAKGPVASSLNIVFNLFPVIVVMCSCVKHCSAWVRANSWDNLEQICWR